MATRTSGAHTGHGRRRMRAAACCSLAFALSVALAALASSALADADPASDVLLAQDAFFPYQPAVSHGLENGMNAVLRSAKKAGLPLKVAVIGSREDLGAIPDFFGHPQSYAEFLDKEISYNNRPPLLVVMPAGFGVVAAGPTGALAAIRVDTRHGSNGLVRSGIEAVLALVRARGSVVPAPATPPSSSTGGGPPAAVLFAIPVVLLVLLGVVGLLRGRRRRRGRPQRTTGRRR